MSCLMNIFFLKKIALFLKVFSETYFSRVKPSRPTAGFNKSYLSTRQLHSYGMWSFAVKTYTSATTLSSSSTDEFRPFVVTLHSLYGSSGPWQHPSEASSDPEWSSKQRQRWQSHGGSMCPAESCGDTLKHYSAMCCLLFFVNWENFVRSD